MSKKRQLGIFSFTFAVGFFISLLAGCNDTPEGQSCSHQGDTWARHGVVLHCTKVGKNDLRWSK